VQQLVVKRWLLAVIITAGVFAVWFGLSVLTYDDDPRIDQVIGRGPIETGQKAKRAVDRQTLTGGFRASTEGRASRSAKSYRAANLTLRAEWQTPALGPFLVRMQPRTP